MFLGEVPIAKYETPGDQRFADTIAPYVKDSNTILLAHKILRPGNYDGGSGTDPGYVVTSTFDHMRWADTYADGSYSLDELDSWAEPNAP